MVRSKTVRGTLIGFLIGIALSAYIYISTLNWIDSIKQAYWFEEGHIGTISVAAIFEHFPPYKMSTFFVIVTIILWMSAGLFIGFVLDYPYPEIINKVIFNVLIAGYLVGIFFGTLSDPFNTFFMGISGFGGGLLALWATVLITIANPSTPMPINK